MKIDLHVHSKERSSCSTAWEKEHIESAREFGLDAIVFTDHNKLVPRGHLRELNAKYKPFRIFGGIEITIKDRGEDVLVLGVNDNILEEREWSYEELHNYVSGENGFIALAHPYRYKDFVNIDIENYTPHAIEIHSTNIGQDDENRIKELARSLNAGLLTNSDAHNANHVGIYYNELHHTPENEIELARMLKEGEYDNACSPGRVSQFNENVREKETLIKKLINEGKDRACYENLTGNWAGEFDRVEMGKSYIIYHHHGRQIGYTGRASLPRRMRLSDWFNGLMTILIILYTA